jgi:formiminotetrahydrofolate cyclodeaminase
MPSLSRLPIEQLFADAASTEPAPGGGSVTALCGMLGVALVLKALRISLRRREDAADHAGTDAGLEALARTMAADADADADSFANYIRALQLPKGTEEEASERAFRLEEAALAATEAGLAAGENALEAVRQARAVQAVVSRTMAPDITAGLALLDVLRLNAVHNAEANIAGVKTPARREALSARLNALR